MAAKVFCWCCHCWMYEKTHMVFFPHPTILRDVPVNAVSSPRGNFQCPGPWNSHAGCSLSSCPAVRTRHGTCRRTRGQRTGNQKIAFPALSPDSGIQTSSSSQLPGTQLLPRSLDWSQREGSHQAQARPVLYLEGDSTADSTPARDSRVLIRGLLWGALAEPSFRQLWFMYKMMFVLGGLFLRNDPWIVQKSSQMC